MRPETDNLDHTFFRVNLVDQAMLDIDTSGIGAGEVSDKLFEGRWGLKRIIPESVKKSFSLGL
jgi:hypothetical protein